MAGRGREVRALSAPAPGPRRHAAVVVQHARPPALPAPALGAVVPRPARGVHQLAAAAVDPLQLLLPLLDTLVVSPRLDQSEMSRASRDLCRRQSQLTSRSFLSLLRLLRDPDLDLVLEFLAGSAGLVSGLAVSSAWSALSTMLTYEWTMLRGEATAHCSERGMEPGPAQHSTSQHLLLTTISPGGGAGLHLGAE